jgi:hypothetical protein
MLGKREDTNIHPYFNTSIMPLKFPTLPMKFHSTIPPQPVGSERVRNAGIITSIGSFNKYAPPPASSSPFRMQPITRSPSAVSTLFEYTRLLQFGIIIGSAHRHICIQSQVVRSPCGSPPPPPVSSMSVFS